MAAFSSFISAFFVLAALYGKNMESGAIYFCRDFNGGGGCWQAPLGWTDGYPGNFGRCIALPSDFAGQISSVMFDGGDPEVTLYNSPNCNFATQQSFCLPVTLNLVGQYNDWTIAFNAGCAGNVKNSPENAEFLRNFTTPF